MIESELIRYNLDELLLLPLFCFFMLILLFEYNPNRKSESELSAKRTQPKKKFRKEVKTVVPVRAVSVTAVSEDSDEPVRKISRPNNA